MKVLFSFLAKKLLTIDKKGAIIMLYFGTPRKKLQDGAAKHLFGGQVSAVFKE